MTSVEFLAPIGLICVAVFLSTCAVQATPTPFDYQKRALVIWGYSAKMAGNRTYHVPTLYIVK